MLSAFRRKFDSSVPTPASQARPPEAAAPAPTLDGEMVDALEADVLKAIRHVTEAISSASGHVAGNRRELAAIQGAAGSLAEAGRGAAEQSQALASSVEELAATSGDITAAMAQAGARVGEAVEGAREASALIAELARATEEIAGIVDTIAAVARQTNLLALNATIEAARAGPAGRGFAVVAGEVKSLSVETGNAAGDIRARIERLRGRAAASMAAVERVAGTVGEVEPVFAAVSAAVEEQDAAIGDLARRAAETSAFVDRVSREAARVDEAAESAAARTGRAAEAAASAEVLANALVQRFVAVMRQNEVGDRREHDRFPTDLKVRVRSGGREAVTGTVDIGLGGVLLKPTPGLEPAPGASLDIDMAAVGTVPAEVVKVSPMGVHCRLRSPDPDIHGRFARLVAEVEEEYRPLIKVAQGGARRVAMAIEGAVAAGRLTREAVFDAEYRPIAGTDPQQYETGYLGAFEDILPEIQEPLLISDNAMVFCIAVDRNGYVPVHNRRFSQAQRRGETAWNTANARNRRIFDDRAGIAAARSTRPFLVQAYNRDMGGGMMVMMREVDAPIRVFGRHWGGFRTAYRL